MTPAEHTLRRVPYSGMWLDEFCLVAVPGGALLAGGSEWHRDGAGAVIRPTAGAAFWSAASGEWEELPPLPHPRQHAAAVSLPDGRALLLGGRAPDSPELASTLFWEPRTRRFREGPSLLAARGRPSAVVLPDGAVLVVGSDFDDDLERGTRAELLRPGASAWEPAGQTVRVFHPGPVCVSGSRAVIAGGRDNGLGFAIVEGVHYAPPLDQGTEIWEPERLAWRGAGPLTEPREEAAGVTLSDGRLLVAGGWHRGTCLASAETWEPSTEQWSPTGAFTLARSSFALTALAGGRAAISGGLEEGMKATASVELWSPEHGRWTAGTPLARGRAGHHVAEVGPGVFLVVGGSRSPDDVPETTSEVWRPV